MVYNTGTEIELQNLVFHSEELLKKKKTVMYWCCWEWTVVVDWTHSRIFSLWSSVSDGSFLDLTNTTSDNWLIFGACNWIACNIYSERFLILLMVFCPSKIALTKKSSSWGFFFFFFLSFMSAQPCHPIWCILLFWKGFFFFFFFDIYWSVSVVFHTVP